MLFRNHLTCSYATGCVITYYCGKLVRTDTFNYLERFCRQKYGSVPGFRYVEYVVTNHLAI